MSEGLFCQQEFGSVCFESWTGRRTLLLSGDFFLGGVVVATLAKLMLRLRELDTAGAALNRSAADAMLVGAAILRLGTSAAIAHAMDDDSRDRIITSLRVKYGTCDSHAHLVVLIVTELTYKIAMFTTLHFEYCVKN